MFSKIINTICLPIRFVFSHEKVNRLGLKSLRDERYDIVKKHCKGRLLDVGSGNNQLVKSYGHNSVGVDVHDFGGDAVIIEDSANLPFENGSFQTVSYVASLNHIPNREEAIKEADRILTDDGRVLITMISPFLGTIRHKLAWWDPDQREKDLKEGEEMGLSHKHLLSIMNNAEFKLVARKKFILGLNNLYIFEKK